MVDGWLLVSLEIYGNQEFTLNIYVGNLSYSTSEEDLRQAFSAHGTVSEVSVVMDKMTGKSRGFGFVVMPNQAEAQAALNNLNDTELQGRRLRINEARPREDRPSGGGGGGFRPSREGGGGFRPSRGPREGGFRHDDRGGRDW